MNNYLVQHYQVVECIKKTPKSNHSIITEQTYIVKNQTNQYFIAKKIQLSDEKTLNELNLYHSINHPNIIKIIQTITQQNWLYVIEEYCEQGDLGYHIRRQIRKKKACFSEELLEGWLLQTLLAMEYLHNQKIIHRDIKPENIFLTSSGNIKLGSFKLSKVLDSELDYAQTILGSSYYMAPQLLENKGYDYKIDLWAFGCLIYELCSLRPLFKTSPTSNIIDIIHRITKNKIDDLPVIYSKQLNSVFQKCMKKKPHERPSAKQLLKTPYFLEAMKKFIKQRGLNLHDKIPIKKYKIHANVMASRIKSAQSRKSQEKISLEIKSNKYQRNNSRQRSTSKEKKSRVQIQPERISKRVSSEKITSKDKNKNQSENSNYSKGNCIVITPSLMLKPQKLQPPPLLSKQEPMLPPPSLPKPEKKYISPKQKSSKLPPASSNHQSNQQISKNDSPTQLSFVNQNLEQVFKDLNIKEYDQQASFEFEQQARLTHLNTLNEQQLVQTYNSMLRNLIEQINQKYSPDMQCIQQRTNEFDSNQFAKFHRRFE